MPYRISIPVLVALAVAAVPVRAPAGTLTTRDGQTFGGGLTLTDTHVVVTPAKAGEARRVPLKDVARATFADPAAPAIEYANPRRDKREPAAKGRVFVEYFADREMTDRRLARYEGQVNQFFDFKTLPDPLVPGRCAVRYTARVASKVSREHAFIVEAHGPVRLWVDGQLRIDKWGAKGTDKHSSPGVPLTAGKAVSVRLEVASGESSFLVRLHWKAAGVDNPHIPVEAYQLPEGAMPPPEVAVTAPADDAYLRDPKSVTFDVKAEAAMGVALKSVDVIAGTAVIGSAAAAAGQRTGPFKIEWKEPPPGVYKVRVRATDDKGVSGYAEALDLSITDTGADKSLPAPWGQQTLGKKDVIPGAASFAGGTFTLTKAGGQITEDSDSPHFVYQPVYGDFEVVARVASLAPNDNPVGPLAGVMVRENMSSLDRLAAVVVGPDATVFARRTEYWGRTVAAERTEGPVNWLRLVRHANRLRAYTSGDGKAWTLLGADRIELPERVFVGLCAMSRDKQTPATATFDRVAVSPGPPALVHSAEGILFRSGTFLAAEVLGLKEGKLAYNREGKRVYRDAADVARLVYKAVPTELAEKAPANGVGVLLASGDFAEGELGDVSYRVKVSNVVFGPRTFTIKGNDVLAIYLKDPESPTQPYALTATDGSVYQGRALKVEGDAVTVEDVTLGVVTVARKDVARLECR